MIEKYNTGGRLMKRFDKVKFMCPVDSSMIDGYVSVSDISKRKGNSPDYTVFRKSTDSGNYWDAGSLLFEINNNYTGTTRDSRIHCGNSDSSSSCVEKK